MPYPAGMTPKQIRMLKEHKRKTAAAELAAQGELWSNQFKAAKTQAAIGELGYATTRGASKRMHSMKTGAYGLLPGSSSIVRRARHLNRTRAMRSRADELRQAGHYVSPFEFQSHNPIPGQPDFIVPEGRYRGETAQRIAQYSDELNKRFRIKETSVVGSNIRFRTGEGTISLPLLGPVYSRTKGEVSGYQASVSMIRFGESGAAITTAEEEIMRSLRSGANFKEMRRAVESTHRYLRHREVSPYMKGVPAMLTGMDMLHPEQIRWGADQIIPASELSSAVQDLRYSGFRFGGEMLYGVRGQSEVPIKNIKELGTVIPELLSFASRKVGQKLHWDPLSDHAPLAGRFTTFHESDIDPFGNLQKAGYKFGQQFRTVGMDVSSMGGYAHAVNKLGVRGSRGTLFGGRLLRTFTERQASMRAATLDPRAALKAGSADVVSGLNVYGTLLFGHGADLLPETESVMMSRQLAGVMKAGGAASGLKHVGVGTPVFTGTTGKGNVIGFLNAHPRLAKGAHIARAGQFKTSAQLVRSMMYGYARAGLEKGMTWESMTGALRRAVGEDRFLPGSGEAVLNAAERLFTDPKTAVEESMQMLRKFGAEMGGVTPADFIVRNSAGSITGMRVLEHVGIREQALSKAQSYLQHGLGIGGGQKVAANYASIFRGLGSDSLADLFSATRRNSTMMGALDFRQNVLGTLGHLLDPTMANGSVRGEVASMTLGELRTAIAPHSSQVRDMLARGRVTGSYQGLADELQKSGILPQLFGAQGYETGFHLKFGENVPVAGTLTKTYASAAYEGTLREMAIPNVSHTNIKDVIASRVLKMATRDDLDIQASSLTNSLLEQYLGGKKSLIAQLASPRIGSEMISTIQKSTTLHPNQYASTVNQYLDALVKAQRLTPQQRAAMDPTKQRYAFVSGSRLGELSAEHRAIFGEQQFLRSVATRDPVKGRGIAMRMLFVDDKILPENLRAQLGALGKGDGIITGISDANFLEGDTDFDHIRNLLAERVKGDHKTEMLLRGFNELESAQVKTLGWLDVDTRTRIHKDRAKSQQVLEDYLSGLEGHGVSPEVKKLFAKTMGTSVREDSLLAATGLKALTGFSHGPAMQRQIVSEAMHAAAGKGPFGSANTVAQYYMQDFLPGMQQLFISKHNVKGKQTLQMIENMTAVIHNAAKLRAAGETGANMTNAYQQAVEAVRGVISDVHTIAGGETNVAFAGAHAEELFGLKGTQKEISELISSKSVFPNVLKSGRGAQTVEAIVEAEMAMSPHLSWMNKSAIGEPLMGAQYKDAYSTEQIIKQLRTVQSSLPTGATPVQHEINRLMNANLQASLQVIDSAQAKAAATQAEKFSSEVGQAIAGGVTDVSRRDLKATMSMMGEAVLDSVHKNPKAYGLAGIAAGGLLALGVLNWAGRKVDQWTTPAGQETGVPTTPRGEYVVPEESMIGHQLNGTMRLPPDSIPAMIQGFNRADPRSDIRVMDTRMGMSDRVVGYDAEDTMSSLYARKQI